MKHVPLKWWASFNARMHEAGGPGFFLLGELLDGDPSVVAKAWRDGGFDAVFDFPLAFAIADVFCRNQSPAKLAAVLTNDRRDPDASKLVTLLDNHDLPRIRSVCKGSMEAVGEALTFLFAMRGIPSMTWGTEEGFQGDQEPYNRPSMQFDETELKRLIHAKLTARNKDLALSRGTTRIAYADKKNVAIVREAGREQAVILVGQDGWSPPASLDLPPCRIVVPHGYARIAVCFGVRKSATPPPSGLRTVHLAGPEGTSVVGSGPELGDWNPATAVTLPATLELPVSGVFVFKGYRPTAPETERWSKGDDEVLFVAPGNAALDVTVPFRN